MRSEADRDQALTKEQRKQPSEAVVRMLQVSRRSLGSAAQIQGYGESLKEKWEHKKRTSIAMEREQFSIGCAFLVCSKTVALNRFIVSF